VKHRSKLWLVPAVLVAASPVWGAVGLRVFVVEAFHIPSPSMTPTLQTGDDVIALKTSAHRTPERGAVRVFVFPSDPSKDFVSRVVGLAGDRVRVLPDGTVARNGRALPRCALGPWPMSPDVGDASEALQAVMEADGARRYIVLQRASVGDLYANAEHCVRGECVVPAGHALTLGDNRDNSYDGRFWGFVPVNNFRAGPRWIHGPAHGGLPERRMLDPQGSPAVPPSLRTAWDACLARLR
jgi:signal peptidase I